MATGRSVLPASLILLLLLVVASEVSKTGEARNCDSQSHMFKGPCFRDSNCANVCKNEGFPGGKCHGLRQRCFCEKPC